MVKKENQDDQQENKTKLQNQYYQSNQDDQEEKQKTIKIIIFKASTSSQAGWKIIRCQKIKYMKKIFLNISCSHIANGPRGPFT